MTLCPLQFSKLDLLRITLLDACGETDVSGRYLVLDGDTVASVSSSDELFEPSDIERTGANGSLAGVSYADPTVKWINFMLTVNGSVPALEVLLMNANPHTDDEGNLIGHDRCSGPSNRVAIEPIYVEDEAICDEEGAMDIWNLFPLVSRWTRSQERSIDGQTVLQTQYTGRVKRNPNWDNPHGNWTTTASEGDTPLFNIASCFAEHPFLVSARPEASCAFQTIGSS